MLSFAVVRKTAFLFVQIIAWEMTKARLLELVVKRLSGPETPEEASELDKWAEDDSKNRQWLDGVTDEEQLEQEIQYFRNIDPAAGYARWVTNRQLSRKSVIRRIFGWSAAAIVVIAVSVTALTRRSSSQRETEKTLAAILPGRNTATLTLANGLKVLLDTAVTGELAMQGNTKLVKLDSGSLSYSGARVANGEDVPYNVLTTPKSGQYQLVLPDGSHVWLNNVSSLRYPTAFIGKDRMVELTGEAYFEIAKDPTKPFIVKVNGEEVHVLGTSLNIMAYSEEGTIQTTLLTGAVRVVAGNNKAVQLRPDEQAEWDGADRLVIVKNVPSQDIISWKNGFFYFGRASFQEVMRQLARWYNIDVKYEGTAPDLEFGGKIDRSLPLSELLQFLDKNQIHFRLEGRTLVVLPS